MDKGEKRKPGKIRRTRKLLRITIDPENYDYLKENSINAPCLFDKAINELRNLTPFSLVLISQNNEELWAR